MKTLLSMLKGGSKSNLSNKAVVAMASLDNIAGGNEPFGKVEVCRYPDGEFLRTINNEKVDGPCSETGPIN